MWHSAGKGEGVWAGGRGGSSGGDDEGERAGGSSGSSAGGWVSGGGGSWAGGREKGQLCCAVLFAPYAHPHTCTQPPTPTHPALCHPKHCPTPAYLLSHGNTTSACAPPGSPTSTRTPPPATVPPHLTCCRKEAPSPSAPHLGPPPALWPCASCCRPAARRHRRQCPWRRRAWAAR